MHPHSMNGLRRSFLCRVKRRGGTAEELPDSTTAGQHQHKVTFDQLHPPYIITFYIIIINGFRIKILKIILLQRAWLNSFNPKTPLLKTLLFSTVQVLSGTITVQYSTYHHGLHVSCKCIWLLRYIFIMWKSENQYLYTLKGSPIK